MFKIRKWKKVGLIGFIVLFFGFLVGCSDESASGDTNQLKIVTATTTGAYYPIGGVMASILSDELEGYNFTAEASGGSQENTRLIDSGQAHIGFIGSDSAYNAYHGLESFEGKAIELAGLAQIYSMPFHVVTLANSDIESIEDLEGKAVAVGAPGSGTSGKAKIILEGYGLIFDEKIEAQYLNFQEGADALVDGNVDAVIISVGMPSGNIQELATSHDIKLIPFESEKVAELSETYPYLIETVIPGGSYNGIDGDVNTVGAPTDILVDPDLDEELVYEIVKALYDTHYDKFVDSHASMKDSTLEIAPNTTVPLHPGAEKFYKEKGVLE